MGCATRSDTTSNQQYREDPKNENRKSEEGVSPTLQFGDPPANTRRQEGEAVAVSRDRHRLFQQECQELDGPRHRDGLRRERYLAESAEPFGSAGAIPAHERNA